jgi:hypothetical protein
LLVESNKKSLSDIRRGFKKNKKTYFFGAAFLAGAFFSAAALGAAAFLAGALAAGAFLVGAASASTAEAVSTTSETGAAATLGAAAFLGAATCTSAGKIDTYDLLSARFLKITVPSTKAKSV